MSPWVSIEDYAVTARADTEDHANQLRVRGRLKLDVGDLSMLVLVGRTRSLSAAAKARGVSVSTVARRLDALEATLKLRLVDRGASGATLTEAGTRIAALAGPLDAQLGEIDRAAQGLRGEAASEPVRVSATEFVVSDVLAPALPLLWRTGVAFPVHLQSQVDVVSLAGRAADLAVRMTRPEGASLLVRKLGELRLGLFASPAYVAGRDPASIELADERLLLLDDSFGRVPETDWLDRHGLTEAAALRTGSVRALLVAATAGAGIAILPAVFARGLVEVAAPPGLPSRTPWLTTHRDLRRVPRVAAVHRWVVSAFAALGG